MIYFYLIFTELSNMIKATIVAHNCNGNLDVNSYSQGRIQKGGVPPKIGKKNMIFFA